MTRRRSRKGRSIGKHHGSEVGQVLDDERPATATQQQPGHVVDEEQAPRDDEHRLEHCSGPTVSLARIQDRPREPDQVDNRGDREGRARLALPALSARFTGTVLSLMRRP